MWRCSVCGFTMEGEMPEQCPKCGAPKEKLMVLDEEKANLIVKSELTNDMHIALSSLLDEVIDVAITGEEENLDPGCVKVFQTAIEQATIIKQMVKAELAGHMNKGKW